MLLQVPQNIAARAVDMGCARATFGLRSGAGARPAGVRIVCGMNLIRRTAWVGGWLAALAMALAALHYRQRAASADGAATPAACLPSADAGSGQGARVADAAQAGMARLERRLAEQERAMQELVEENHALREGRLPGPGSLTVRTAGNPRNPRPDSITGSPAVTPDEQEQMRQRLGEFTGRVQGALARQNEFAASLDTALMTPEQLETHQQLRQMLQKLNDAAAEAGSTTEPQKIGDVRAQVFQNMAALRDLLAKERDAALSEAARKMNCTEAQAKQFVTYINYVQDVTSLSGLWRVHGPETPAQRPGGPGTNTAPH